MQGEDALLEVVDEFCGPGVDGLADDVAAVLGGEMGTDAGESLAGGDGDVGTDDGDVPAAQVEVDVLKLFANALSVAGAALDEEGAVGAEPRGVLHHLLLGEMECEQVVEQAYHVGAVAAAAAHAGLGGDGFVEVGVAAGQGGVVGLQGVVGADDEVVLLVAGVEITYFQVAINFRRECGVHSYYFKGVAEGHGIEDGLEVVVAVGALFHYVQSQVYLRNGECNHRRFGVLRDRRQNRRARVFGFKRRQKCRAQFSTAKIHIIIGKRRGKRRKVSALTFLYFFFLNLTLDCVSLPTVLSKQY